MRAGNNGATAMWLNSHKLRLSRFVLLVSGETFKLTHSYFTFLI